jgi:hypothetical protein
VKKKEEEEEVSIIIAIPGRASATPERLFQAMSAWPHTLSSVIKMVANMALARGLSK